MKKENKKAVVASSSSTATIEVFKKIGYVLIIVSAILILFNFIPSKKVTDSNFLLEKHESSGILIMAEKGGYIQNPANTQKAFDQVIKNSSYTHIVELDVRTSKDGEIVIFEGETLNSAALAEDAEPVYVNQTNLVELKNFNLGRNFVNTDGIKPYETTMSFKSQGLSMLTLKEFLTRYKSSRTSVYYLIDVQETGDAGMAACDKIVEILALEEYDTFDKRVILTSENVAIKNYLSEAASKEENKFVVSGSGDNYTRILVNALKFGYRQLHTPNYEIVQLSMKEDFALGLKLNVAKKGFIQRIEEKNMVVIYTGITTEEEVRALYKIDAHVIASGNPKFVDSTIKQIQKEEKENA